MSLAEREAPALQKPEHAKANAINQKAQVAAQATQLLEEYRRLPWQATSNRHKAEMFGREIARDFLRNPDSIGISMNTWYAGEKPRDKASRQLIADVESQMTFLQGREQVSSEVLAELIRIGAHSPQLEKFAFSQLKLFFRMPTSEEESVAAVLKLVDALIDLYDDREAATLAARIANRDTDIYERHGETSAYFALASLGDPRITDPELETELYKQARAAKIIIGNVSSLLFGHDPAQETKSNIVSNGRPSIIAQKVSDKHADFINQNGVDATMNIFKAKSSMVSPMHPLPLADDLDGSMQDPAFVEAERVRKEEFERFDPGTPIWEKYLAKLGMLYNEQSWIERIKVGQSVELEPVTISVGGMYSATFLLDKLIDVNSKKELLENPQRLLAFLATAVGHFEDLGGPVTDVLICVSIIESTGTQVPTLIRIRSVYEQTSHPAERLSASGTEELLARTEHMDVDSQIEEINANQIRFLNTRWVSVPVDRSWLGNLGYESIDFRKDPDDLTKIVARIRTDGPSFELRLDADFKIDTEGMAFDHPRLLKALHNILLRILSPILCDEEVRDNDGHKTDLSKLFVSRIGHLRLLHEGQQIGEQQIKDFLKNEGQDLLKKNAQRQALLGTTRNTTYVNPTDIKDAPELAPLVAHLPLEAIL